MVIYDLICDSRHEFEGWFKNSEDLVSQQDKGLLRCPVCDSLQVNKKAAAPKLTRKSTATAVNEAKVATTPTELAAANLNANSADAYNQVQDMLAKVHKFIDANFEDVGNKFASEAIRMHKGEKEAANIRGTASADELKELAEEGVAALPMPSKPIDKNKLN